MNKKRWFDILFVALVGLPGVFGLLFVSDDKISTQENRTLVAFPLIVEKGKLNAKFASGFEGWLNDHVGLRNIWLKVHDLCKVSVAGRFMRNPYICWDRKNGWMWQEQKRAPVSWDAEYIGRIAKSVGDFKTWLGEKGVDFRMLLVPDKNVVYRKEALEADVRGVDDDSLERLCGALRAELGDAFIFPRKELEQKSKEETVYYQTSHHWSEAGAFVAWRTLAESILEPRGIAECPALLESSYDIERDEWVREGPDMNKMYGNSVRLLGYGEENHPDDILRAVYPHYYHKNRDRLSLRRSHIFRKKDRFKPRFRWEYPEAVPLRVFVLGTSQTCIMQPFMPYTFSPMEYIRINGGQVSEKKSFYLKRLYAKEIASFKPDVLILCVTMGNCGALHKIAEE